MLAGIIQTIIMALGIATGNISSNAYKGGNVFNEKNEITETKPTIKLQTTNVVNNETYTKNARIINSKENTNDEKWEKWYLGTETNYNNAFLSIRNSVYTQAWVSDKYLRINTWHLYEITPYYTANDNTITIDTDISIELKLSGAIGSNVSSMYSYTAIANDTPYLREHLQDYIDLTLTSSIESQLEQLENNVSWSYTTTQNEQPIGSNYEYELTQRYTSTLTARNGEKVYVLIRQHLANAGQYNFYYWLNYNWNQGYSNAWNNFISITPNTFKIQAEDILMPNYEVVDIPGLMFTIISLPFSFISTAFNLTIFPNTPYAVNFANLFMVILAAFILMWLIKKVFH